MNGVVQVTFTPNSVITCSRCSRKKKLKNASGWNATMQRGAIAGFLCPVCQTPEENAEAEINEATLTYKRDAFGRAIATLKGVSE